MRRLLRRDNKTVAASAMVLTVALTLPFPASASIMKRVYITTTGTSQWSVPSDFNSYDNSVECIGGGGAGDDGPTNGLGYQGGSGGAYAKVSGVNLIGTTSVTVRVGSGGAINANAAGGSGGDTFFMQTSGSNTTCTSGQMVVCGKGGKGGIEIDSAPNIRASATTSIGQVTYASGAGGQGSDAGDCGGGGGGAAGPFGIGGNGGNCDPAQNGAGGGGGNGGGFDAAQATTSTGSPGGNGWRNDGRGSSAGIGGIATAGTAGSGGGGGGAGAGGSGGGGGAGSEWDDSHGSGGGAGGVGDTGGTTSGGLYGGGGGGGTSAGGGAQGIIVVTYYVPSRNFKLLGTLRLYGGTLRINQAQ